MTYGVCDRCLAQQKSWKEGDDFGFLERNLQLTHIKSHRPYKLICTTYNCCRVFTTASELVFIFYFFLFFNFFFLIF